MRELENSRHARKPVSVSEVSIEAHQLSKLANWAKTNSMAAAQGFSRNLDKVIGCESLLRSRLAGDNPLIGLLHLLL